METGRCDSIRLYLETIFMSTWQPFGKQSPLGASMKKLATTLFQQGQLKYKSLTLPPPPQARAMRRGGDEKMKTVWMYGGGRQSIRIATLILDGLLPLPDIICIADTGREKQSTWDYLSKHVAPALRMMRKVYIVPKSQYATVDLWGGKDGDSLLIPAFSNITGGLSKLSPFCSNEWKARVCDRWLKKKMGIKEWVSWIGFSVDEPKRFKPRKASQGDAVYFPLVDGYPQTKQECIDGVREFGWPTPVHSACWMCPNQTDNEWLDNSKSDQQKAIEFDREIRLKDPNAFLHRSCLPLEHVVFHRTDKPTKEPCESGLCML